METLPEMTATLLYRAAVSAAPGSGSCAPALKASRSASPPLPSWAPATSRVLDMLASDRQVAVEVIDTPKHIAAFTGEDTTALAAKAARFGAADQPVMDRLLADRHRESGLEITAALPAFS